MRSCVCWLYSAPRVHIPCPASLSALRVPKTGGKCEECAEKREKKRLRRALFWIGGQWLDARGNVILVNGEGELAMMAGGGV